MIDEQKSKPAAQVKISSNNHQRITLQTSKQTAFKPVNTSNTISRSRSRSNSNDDPIATTGPKSQPKPLGAVAASTVTGGKKINFIELNKQRIRQKSQMNAQPRSRVNLHQAAQPVTKNVATAAVTTGTSTSIKMQKSQSCSTLRVAADTTSTGKSMITSIKNKIGKCITGKRNFAFGSTI